MGPHARLGNTSPPAQRLGQRLGCQGQAKNPDWQGCKNLPPRQYAGAGGLRRSGKGRFEKRRVPEPSLLAHHAVLASDAAVVDGHRGDDALHGDAVRRVAAAGCVFSGARPVAAGRIGQAGLQGGEAVQRGLARPSQASQGPYCPRQGTAASRPSAASGGDSTSSSQPTAAILHCVEGVAERPTHHFPKSHHSRPYGSPTVLMAAGKSRP